MTSKFALVIANTEYQDASFAKLTAPGKDAEEFAQVLRELASFDDVQILLNEGESKTRRLIARFFAERKRDDLLLLYFSGHGIRNEQGQLFLAANDTEISVLEASGIPAEFVTAIMNNSRSQRQLLILDCCNSGAFAYGSKSASGVGKSMGIATAFEGSGFGRVVLTATDATQYAWEGDKVIGDTQKSVFTHFLIEGLKGEADRDGDGRIDVDELYDYSYEQVVRRTPKQTPGKWSYKQQGDIVLRENLKPREVKAAPLPSELLEMLSHPNSGVRRAGIQELISLLDGKHLGLAHAAQEKLKEIAENDDSLSLRKSASDTLNSRGLSIEKLVPIPVEIPKEEKKIENQARVPHLFAGKASRVDAAREETPRDVPAKGKTLLNSKLRLFIGVFSVLIGVPLCIMVGVNYSINNLFHFVTITVTSSPTNAVSTMPISQPKSTDTPSPTQTTIASVPTLGIGSTMTSDKDGMTLLYVPAGEFTMGSENGNADEKPAHKVTLGAFWIDKTEVTNAMYTNCVTDGKCNPPSSVKSSTRDSYYGNVVYDNFPVIYVSWKDTQAYCTWAARKLPTEAEWEKAARGIDGRAYPWGNSAPKFSLLNYNKKGGDTIQVGRYLQGASPYGALDMAGNVWEWVADWYDASYYRNSPASNPSGPGPAPAQYRVVRGGSWGSDVIGVRSAARNGSDPTKADVSVGFRCAMSATP